MDSPRPPLALITGGCGALARALVAELEGRGWQVAAPGREAMNVRSTAAVQGYVARLGRVDLLVNNAAVIADMPLVKMSEADFDLVVDTDLTGAFRVAREVLPLMIQQGAGHIINVGSMSALTGPAGQASYAAAKAGLIALTHSLAMEGGPQNIRANLVLPGYLDTPMSAASLARHREEILARHTLGRLNTVTEAARFIAELHSFEHVSGQVFQLDSRLRRVG